MAEETEVPTKEGRIYTLQDPLELLEHSNMIKHKNGRFCSAVTLTPWVTGLVRHFPDLQNDIC